MRTALILLSIVSAALLIIVVYLASSNDQSKVITSWSNDQLFIMVRSGGIKVDALVCEYKNTRLLAKLPEPSYTVDSGAITLSKATWNALVWVDGANKTYPSPPTGVSVNALYIQYSYSRPNRN